MKPNPYPLNVPVPEAHLMPVRFEFSHPTASTVLVAGSFNQWKPDSKALYSSGDGHFWKETVLAPGSYEYCLVVDGEWMPDPRAKETVPNPFGGQNSVLTVPVSAEATHLADAENLPLKTTVTHKAGRV